MPDPRLLDPVSLFLTDERSDAAVVGSSRGENIDAFEAILVDFQDQVL